MSKGSQGSKGTQSSYQHDVAWRGDPTNYQVDVRPSSASRGSPMSKQRSMASGWYKAPAIAALRNLLLGKAFALVMVIALFMALFLPDIWVISGANSNAVIDVLLTVVMIMFTFEFVSLSISDPAYHLSFFQLMDFIGTVSMIFDISYMFGVDNSAPTVTSNDSGRADVALLRAARAAKIGARAGRLSRVLRILRFLPFLKSPGQDESTGIASMISGRLANLLAVRVAALTIILVMVIPIFDVWTFPQEDFSLQTWVQRLSNNLELGKVSDTLAELDLMKDFYARYEYGPYTACSGSPVVIDGSNMFECNSTDTRLASWDGTKLKTPPRMASALFVHTETFMVGFNMHHNHQITAGTGMATTCFIIFIMVFSGLALSSVVMNIAVRPLERMLGSVRDIATTVFKLSEGIEEEGGDEEEDLDVESSNEMKLLEKVVSKLAIVADLNSTQVVDTKDMGSDDIAILEMMQGVTSMSQAKKVTDRKPQNIRKKGSVSAALKVRAQAQELGVTQEVFDSLGFNTLPLTKQQRISLGTFIISTFHGQDEGFVNTADDLQVLQRFVAAVEKEYLPVAFHSFAHAVDVVHGVARMMRATGSEAFLGELEQYALLIAAIAHDMGHPGMNNGFLNEVGHDLALQYNDRSPLENMHCAKLYSVMSNPSTNVLAKFSKEQYNAVRKVCIETILHTDMMLHGAMVKDLNLTYEMNKETFASHANMSVEEEAAASAAEAEVWSKPDTKLLAMECILHAADVSNPCRQWEVTKAWAWACLDEFFSQGDQEKSLGIPVMFLNDREKLNKPSSQIGFVEFMIAPFVAAQIRLWPELKEFGYNLSANIGKWEEMWMEEVKPSEEERGKVRGRVQKIQDNMTNAINRAA